MHLLTDLDVHLEELGDASVQANGFAFVQVAFTVVGGYALLRAGLGETRYRAQLNDDLHWGVGASYRVNMSDTISTSVSAAAIFSADESWGRPPKRTARKGKSLLIEGEGCLIAGQRT